MLTTFYGYLILRRNEYLTIFLCKIPIDGITLSIKVVSIYLQGWYTKGEIYMYKEELY